MLKDDSDLLLIQNRLVVRFMELYDSAHSEKEKIDKGKRANLESIITTITGQIEPFMDFMAESDRAIYEVEREAARKQYEQLASIMVEMIPLLADAITLRLSKAPGSIEEGGA